jgi:hypothetical protein
MSESSIAASRHDISEVELHVAENWQPFLVAHLQSCNLFLFILKHIQRNSQHQRNFIAITACEMMRLKLKTKFVVVIQCTKQSFTSVSSYFQHYFN